MSDSTSDDSNRDGGTTASLSPYVWNQLSQVAFLTALISAGLLVVLFFVVALVASETGAVGPPKPVAVWSERLGSIGF